MNLNYISELLLFFFHFVWTYLIKTRVKECFDKEMCVLEQKEWRNKWVFGKYSQELFLRENMRNSGIEFRSITV